MKLSMPLVYAGNPRESADQVGPLLEQYARVLAGLDDGRSTWRNLRTLNQLGVTRGTLQLI